MNDEALVAVVKTAAVIHQTPSPCGASVTYSRFTPATVFFSRPYKIAFGPHPHLTRREKRSKLGCTNPIVATILYTLHAKQHVMRKIGTCLHFVALRIT